MKIKVSFKPATIIVLLLALITLNAFSIFFLTRVDQVVTSDLHAYSLRYDEAWETVYRQYFYLTMIPLAISISTGAFSILCILTYRRNRRGKSAIPIYSLLVGSAVTTTVSGFLFSLLDHVVHGELYDYGLVFSYQWANKYWMYARLTLGLDALALVPILASTALVFLGFHQQVEIKGTRAVYYILSVAGLIVIASSMYYESQILALVGLGLTFWGILFGYVKGEEYVKKTISEAAALSPLTALVEILMELGYTEKAVYLPPKYVGNLEDNRAYIVKDTSAKPYVPEQAVSDKSIFFREPEAVLITPPGDGLTKLFERHLGVSFARVDLPYLEENLSKLLIEDFEIAEDFKILTKGNVVSVTIKSSVFENLFREVPKLSNTDSFSCPLSSALACILAKASGKPIVATNTHASQDGKIISIEYRLLDQLKLEGSR